MKRESSKECSVSFLWANESFSLWSCSFEEFNLVFFTADQSAWLVLNQPRKQGFWRNLRYILYTLLYLQRFHRSFLHFYIGVKENHKMCIQNLRIGHLHDGVILPRILFVFLFIFKFSNPKVKSRDLTDKSRNLHKKGKPWRMLVVEVNDVIVLMAHLFMLLAVRISSYGCTREVWRAWKMRRSSPSATLASWVLSKLPKCIHNSIYAQLKAWANSFIT